MKKATTSKQSANHKRSNSVRIMLANNSRRIDALDIKIIREVLDNADTSCTSISKKLGVPLSTIQRRKVKLEGSFLTKKYELNTKDLGWRNAEILMLVQDGKADYMARELMEKFDKVLGTSTRINTTSNIAIYVGFRTSKELHELMEQLRAMPHVANLEWSEIVTETDSKANRMAHLVFDSTA